MGEQESKKLAKQIAMRAGALKSDMIAMFD